jgi:hypothetical protein
MTAAVLSPDFLSDAPVQRVRPKRLKGWVAPEVIPKHVRHCQAGTGKRDWWIYTWRVDTPQNRVRIPYQCNSWRCHACAPHEAAVLWRRITDACAPLEARGFVFVVLTLDQRGFYDKRQTGWRKFRDVREAYRELGRQSQKLLYRLRRWQKRHGMRELRNEWFAVVESHRTGWPHMNLVLYSPQLARHLDQEQAARRAAGETDPRELILLQGELREMAEGAGWGRQSTAERARDQKALAGYVTKLAGFSDRTAGEVAKITQAPKAAPSKFRRLRSGKGFLPPRRSTSDGWTGALIRRQVCDNGDPVVLPLHNVGLEHAANVRDACELEDRIWQEEDETLWKKRAVVARYGPQAVLGTRIQYWEGDRLLPPTDAEAFADDYCSRVVASTSRAPPVVGGSPRDGPHCSTGTDSAGDERRSRSRHMHERAGGVQTTLVGFGA